MKRFATHDFEDLLQVGVLHSFYLCQLNRRFCCCSLWQCAIPVFDGLFEGEDNSDILQLLFAFAHWHGLAKLRMHTDPTLVLFDQATTLVGAKFRRFVNHTSGKFNTRELQREVNARARRSAKKSTTSSALPPAFSAPTATSSTEPDVITARQTKMFNLDTYKYHSLSNYVEHIRKYGTTDLYSTKPV